MVDGPAAGVDNAHCTTLPPLCMPGDTVIDGGNSNYVDDIRRAQALCSGLHYIDPEDRRRLGTERGYCLMIGGDARTRYGLDRSSRARARRHSARTPGRERQDRQHGYLHCGPAGAGHFVKMVHNGIEYGIMAAYAEG